MIAIVAVSSMEKIDFNLKQYEVDFEALQRYEQNAVEDLKRVEHLDEWQPTDYERYYLPRLRLVGIKTNTGLCCRTWRISTCTPNGPMGTTWTKCWIAPMAE